MIFAEKVFADCSPVLPMDAMPPNFAEKTCVNTLKLVKVFSLESFLLCRYSSPRRLLTWLISIQSSSPCVMNGCPWYRTGNEARLLP